MDVLEKYRYVKIFLEIAMQNAYDSVCSRETGQSLYVDPNSISREEKSKTEIKPVELSKQDLERIVSQKKGIFLVPPEKSKFYRPNTVIKDIEQLERKLEQYIEALPKSGKNFYKIDEGHTVATYFYYLVKTLTNSDSHDLLKYIDVFMDFLKDTQFSSLSQESKIGRIELGEEETQKYDVLAKRAEEYYGSETPYTMRYALDRKGFRYTMPFVRYGIAEDQAYIYSIQRKGKIKFRYPRIKEINGRFNRVNSGVKTERDITPSMLISATMFMGMLKGVGIKEVKIADFLTRRFGHYNGINGNVEEASKIQDNITNKFLRTYTRLVAQFHGIEIYSYPNDIDSYLSLRLGEEISSDNPLLNQFFALGLQYGKSQNEIEREEGKS